MPALPPYIIEPIWEQFRALLPERGDDDHPLGCHRPRICVKLVSKRLVHAPEFFAFPRFAGEKEVSRPGLEPGT